MLESICGSASHAQIAFWICFLALIAHDLGLALAGSEEVETDYSGVQKALRIH